MEYNTDLIKTAVSVGYDLKKIKEENFFDNIGENFNIRSIDSSYFLSRFDCHDNAMCINDVSLSDCAIITGFGPTNSPTAGTLSVLFRTIDLQRKTGIYTDIIVSDLGAWNSRNLDWRDIQRNTMNFIEFIVECGFDTKNGKVRSHQDKENLVISGLIAKLLNQDDFLKNREATDRLYDMMNLRGSLFGIMQDGLYTISDIINPLFNGKKRVLVIAGLEEYYFLNLARIVIERLKKVYPDRFISPVSDIGALYTKLIQGFYPFPKMSKSIPESSINVDDSETVLKRKIINCGEHNEKIVMQMIELLSDWSAEKIAEARSMFKQRKKSPRNWRRIKEEYYEFFLQLSRKWCKIAKE